MIAMHSFSQRHALQTQRASRAQMSVARLISLGIEEDRRDGIASDETLAALACRPISEFRKATRHANPAIRRIAAEYIRLLIAEGCTAED